MKYSQHKVCECYHTKCTHNHSAATKNRPAGYRHCNGTDCTCEEFVPMDKPKKAGSPHDQYHK